MGYIVCEECSSYYELQEGENIDDSEDYEFIGNFIYVESLDELNPEFKYKSKHPNIEDILNLTSGLNGNAIGIGWIFGMIFGVILFWFNYPIWNWFIITLISGSLTGFIVGGNSIKGMKNGLFGSFGTLITAIIIFIVSLIVPSLYDSLVLIPTITNFPLLGVIAIISVGIIGLIGGFMGSVIRNEVDLFSQKNELNYGIKTEESFCTNCGSKKRDSIIRSITDIKIWEMKSNNDISGLIYTIYHENDPNIQETASRALQRLYETDFKILFTAFNTKDENLQIDIAHYISSILISDNITENEYTLLASLLNDQNPNIRKGTLKTLFYMYLNENRRNVSNKKIQWLFIKSLNDENISIKLKAIEYLGISKELNAVEPLKELLKTENKLIKWKSAGALGFIGAETELNILIPLIDELIEDLNNDNSDRHEYSIYALDGISNIYKDEKMVYPIIKSLNSTDNKVKNTATLILGKIANKKAVNPLINVLNDEDIEIKINAIISLGKIGDKTAVKPLIKSLNDKDVSVRRVTITSLGKIGDKSAILPLTNLLNDEDKLVRQKVEKILEELSKSENLKYCECGAENSENAKFCLKCGTKLV